MAPAGRAMDLVWHAHQIDPQVCQHAMDSLPCFLNQDPCGKLNPPCEQQKCNSQQVSWQALHGRSIDLPDNQLAAALTLTSNLCPVSPIIVCDAICWFFRQPWPVFTCPIAACSGHGDCPSLLVPKPALLLVKQISCAPKPGRQATIRRLPKCFQQCECRGVAFCCPCLADDPGLHHLCHMFVNSLCCFLHHQVPTKMFGSSPNAEKVVSDFQERFGSWGWAWISRAMPKDLRLQAVMTSSKARLFCSGSRRWW
jgi:hypothetical protein